MPDMADAETNRALVRRLWEDLYRRDFAAVAAHFHEDGTYTDVPTPDDDVAGGPARIAARVELGLGPLERIEDELVAMVAEGGTASPAWRSTTG